MSINKWNDSIYDEVEKNIVKKRAPKDYIHQTVVYEKNNFWKYFLAFLLALLFFLIIWYLFLQNKTSIINNYDNTKYVENYSNNNSWDIEKSWEENYVNTEELSTFYIEKNKCNEDYQSLKEELEKLKQLIYLQKDLDIFFEDINEENLEQKFNDLKETNKFLDNEIIKKQNDKEIKEIYNDLNNSFWNKITYALTEEWLWIEANDKDMSIIIPENSSFPIKKSRTYETRNSYQKYMKFEVYRWNDKLTKNNTFLWEFIIKDLKPIKVTWSRVEVTFDVQKDWKINFVAKDIKYPQNKINFYLDSEVDLLKKTNKDLDKIKNNFKEIEYKVDKKIISESKKNNIKFLQPWKYKVERVVDWDTFTTLLDWKLVYIRMIWIDAPENSKLRKWHIEDYSEESKIFLKNKIEWKIVIFEYDSSQDKIDKYGRHLVYVYIGEENINNSMILWWYAKEYTYNKKYKYSDLFKKSELEAKDKKVWIWK